MSKLNRTNTDELHKSREYHTQKYRVLRELNDSQTIGADCLEELNKQDDIINGIIDKERKIKNNLGISNYLLSKIETVFPFMRSSDSVCQDRRTYNDNYKYNHVEVEMIGDSVVEGKAIKGEGRMMTGEEAERIGGMMTGEGETRKGGMMAEEADMIDDIEASLKSLKETSVQIGNTLDTQCKKLEELNNNVDSDHHDVKKIDMRIRKIL